MQFENHINYNCEIELEDGSTYRIYANFLHNNHLDNWYGWECGAGYIRVSIQENFDVYGGECKNNFLGNLLSEWSPLLEFAICQQSTCTGCTDDLIINKNRGKT